MKKAALFLGLLSSACYAMEKNKELSIWLPDNYVVGQEEQKMRDELWNSSSRFPLKELAEEIINDAFPNNRKMRLHTAFFTAVCDNYLMVLKELIESGISPNFVIPQVIDWMTPLAAAATLSKEDAAHVLLSGGAEPNSIIKDDDNIHSILEFLITANNPKTSEPEIVISDAMIKLFCEHGAIVSSNALELAKEGTLREYLNAVYQKQAPLRAEIAKKLVQQGYEKIASINA